jgi:circadian clock protein KaiC
LVSKAASAESGVGSVVDGIIQMSNFERKGDLLRTMQVIKMKGTAHSRAKYVIDLTGAGVLVTTLLKGGL